MNATPDEPAGTSPDSNPAVRRVLAIVADVACVYYLLSATTLPFVNMLWFGEIAVLAIFQLPKSFLKSVVHKLLLQAVHTFGLSRGSPSPDYIATHGWAMGIMAAAPALLLVTVFALLLRGRARIWLIGMVLLFATIDALVTIWFDSSSNLKLYNGSYF